MQCSPELTSLEIHDWPQWLKAHRKTPGDMLRIQTLDHYGVPQGLVEVGASGAGGFIAAGEMAWQLGTPFTEWWAAHPEYHREPTAA